MMKFKKTDFIALAVLAATLVHLIIVYPSLPDLIVTNWGFNGDVSYGGKSTLWMLMGMNAGLFVLFFIIPKIDPKGSNYAKVDGFYSSFRMVMIIFMAGLTEIVMLSADNPNRFNVGKIVMLAISLLFMFIGNYLPKCKQSYTLGIKTMWTLADERVWNDTHRIGGVTFVVMGLVGFVSALFLPENVCMYIFLISTLGGTVFTFVYSYLSYRKYNN